MKIFLENIGKRYNAEWIFRGVNLMLTAGKSYAVLGANGSGKSTLLQVIGGNISASEGQIRYVHGDIAINSEEIFREVSFASPYLELPEEMTMKEVIKFHFSFKNLLPGIRTDQVDEILDLRRAAGKQLRYFSSGMKQRVRLGLAILSDTPILLLDEPLSNLDKNGGEWYRNLIMNYTKDRLILVCSNHQEKEYDFCTQVIQIEEYRLSLK